MEKQIGNFEDINFDNVKEQSVLFKKILLEEQKKTTIVVAILSIILTVFYYLLGFALAMVYLGSVEIKASNRGIKSLAERNNLKQENIDIHNLTSNLKLLIIE